MENNNIQDFHVLGLSYEKADVETRGKYSFFDGYTDEFIQKAKDINTDDFFVLSTCNRTEVYYFSPEPEKMIEAYSEQVGGDAEELKDVSFIKSGRDAINHMFRVSTGVDSQILGDFEVLSQMKKAYYNFKKKGASNATLERIINTAIQISKQIKNETSLSDGATSVSYAAVQYILQNVPDFNTKNIVLFGTGKIGRNTCENLIKHSDNNKITLVNRTFEKAEALSDKLHLTPKRIEELPEVLKTTDILIVATGAPKPTITKDILPQDKGMLIIDLSIPENVAGDVADLKKIKVINVDELSQVISKTFESRKFEIPKVETIVRLKLWEFEDWLESRKYVPAIQAFKKRMEFLKEHEAKQLAKKNIPADAKDPLADRLIHKMTSQFADHIMEHPDKAEEVIKLMNEVFHLDLEE